MQVQGTNDSSIVSKLSSSNKGYCHDDYLHMFVEKQQVRSPIINRGYYIRYKAIDKAFKSWFSLLPPEIQKSQIISLGAGFDTSYFRLKKLDLLPPGCKYIEIDFPEVMKRKLECLKLSRSQMIDLSAKKEENSHIVASFDDYILLGINLKDIKGIEACFNSLEVDFSVPTLFLSECAVTYMDFNSSDYLLRWIQEHFINSVFVAYEQVHPDDGFGIVMQSHFTSLGCPLKSLPLYPDEEKQCSRYTEIGWSSCSCISMFQFFASFPEEEKDRVQLLELFDEYEMWHEKCHHYVLIWACQGTCQLPEIFHKRNSNSWSKDQVGKSVWSLVPVPHSLQRFGHQILLLSSDILLISGGFGPCDKKHQRLGGLTLCQLSSKSCCQAQLVDDNKLLNKRMYHSMTKLSDGTVIVMGGRASPNKAFNEVLALMPSKDLIQPKVIDSNNGNISFSVEQKSVMPLPTWRHSSAVVEIEGTENIVIFGGCAGNGNVTDECYALNSKTWIWSKVQPQLHTPSPRHSHSCVAIDNGKVIVACGLARDETILNSVYLLDCHGLTWSTLNVIGLLPRYSHISHFYEDKIFLLGGITSVPGLTLGMSIINLTNLTAIELSAPGQDPEFPILLSGHCSYIHEGHIIITGGGGNCFSFGTHFNSRDIVVDLTMLQ